MAKTAKGIVEEIKASFPSDSAQELPSPLVITDQVRDVNRVPKAPRDKHILKAARNPSSVHHYRADARLDILLAAAVDRERDRTTSLQIQQNPDTQEWQIAEALLLLGVIEDATEAFALAVERYGLPIQLGGESGLFIATATVPIGEGIEAVGVAHGRQELGLRTFALSTGTELEHRWSWALDVTKYHRSL